MTRFSPLAALVASALLALSACAPLPPAPASSPSTPNAPTANAQAPLRLIGHFSLPFGTTYGGTTVGGLSGIDYDPVQQQYLLISDDRSTHDPARVYTARLHYTAERLAPPEFTGITFLRHANGQRFPSPRQPIDGMDVPDAEAVRWVPGTTRFLWTSEGDFARGWGPQLRENRSEDGAAVRSFVLPQSFQPAPRERRGPRGNGTLEGLALTPDARTAWVSMELPWWQDGPVATPASPGAPVRITALEVASGAALRQIAYQPDAVPQPRRVPMGPQMNGVSEILADGPHHLLVLERAYSAGPEALTPGNHRAVPKTLVADLGSLGLSVDNLEGMTWGPPLADGTRVLVLVSDDNFNPAQATQFVALAYRPAP